MDPSRVSIYLDDTDTYRETVRAAASTAKSPCRRHPQRRRMAALPRGDRNHWDGDHNYRLSGRNSVGLCFISANHFIPIDQPQIVEKLLADFLH